MPPKNTASSINAMMATPTQSSPSSDDIASSSPVAAPKTGAKRGAATQGAAANKRQAVAPKTANTGKAAPALGPARRGRTPATPAPAAKTRAAPKTAPKTAPLVGPGDSDDEDSKELIRPRRGSKAPAPEPVAAQSPWRVGQQAHHRYNSDDLR